MYYSIYNVHNNYIIIPFINTEQLLMILPGQNTQFVRDLKKTTQFWTAMYKPG